MQAVVLAPLGVRVGIGLGVDSCPHPRRSRRRRELDSDSDTDAEPELPALPQPGLSSVIFLYASTSKSIPASISRPDSGRDFDSIPSCPFTFTYPYAIRHRFVNENVNRCAVNAYVSDPALLCRRTWPLMGGA